MMYAITTKELQAKQDDCLAALQAKLSALDGVIINTKHKTLTTKAISGDYARIGDYAGIGKALYVSYPVKRANGSTRYERDEIIAYTYNNPDGSEIGADGFVRTSRTMTPAELDQQKIRVMDSLEKSIATLKREREQSAALVAAHNKLAAAVAEHNKGISAYSDLARIA